MSSMLNRADVVEAISKEAGLPQTKVNEVLDSLWNVVGSALKNKKVGGVQLTGYLTIAAVKRKPRVGRNPHTGEKIDIPARTSVTIKPGSKLKAFVS